MKGFTDQDLLNIFRQNGQIRANLQGRFIESFGLKENYLFSEGDFVITGLIHQGETPDPAVVNNSDLRSALYGHLLHNEEIKKNIREHLGLDPNHSISKGDMDVVRAALGGATIDPNEIGDDEIRRKVMISINPEDSSDDSGFGDKPVTQSGLKHVSYDETLDSSASDSAAHEELESSTDQPAAQTQMVSAIKQVKLQEESRGDESTPSAPTLSATELIKKLDTSLSDELNPLSDEPPTIDAGTHSYIANASQVEFEDGPVNANISGGVPSEQHLMLPSGVPTPNEIPSSLSIPESDSPHEEPLTTEVPALQRKPEDEDFEGEGGLPIFSYSKEELAADSEGKLAPYGADVSFDETLLGNGGSIDSYDAPQEGDDEEIVIEIPLDDSGDEDIDLSDSEDDLDTQIDISAMPDLEPNDGEGEEINLYTPAFQPEDPTPLLWSVSTPPPEEDDAAPAEPESSPEEEGKEGPELQGANSDTTPSYPRSASIVYYVNTDKGGRRDNEDNAFIRPPGYIDHLPFGQVHIDHEGGVDGVPLVVIADGMGGYLGGAVASEEAKKVFSEYFKHNTPKTPRDAAFGLLHCMFEANRKVYLAATWDDISTGKAMGTTCIAAVVFRENLVLVHSGDSRAYLLRDGTLHPLTKDMNMLEMFYLIDGDNDRDTLNMQRENNPRWGILTSCVGASAGITVSAMVINLVQGDQLLVISDGFLSCSKFPFLIEDEEEIEANMAEIMNNNPHDLAQQWDLLCKMAKDQGCKDNVTAAMVQFLGSRFPVSTGNAPNITELDLADFKEVDSSEPVHPDSPEAQTAKDRAEETTAQLPDAPSDNFQPERPEFQAAEDRAEEITAQLPDAPSNNFQPESSVEEEFFNGSPEQDEGSLQPGDNGDDFDLTAANQRDVKTAVVSQEVLRKDHTPSDKNPKGSILPFAIFGAIAVALLLTIMSLFAIDITSGTVPGKQCRIAETQWIGISMNALTVPQKEDCVRSKEALAARNSE